jgi:hypothetical protein
VALIVLSLSIHSHFRIESKSLSIGLFTSDGLQIDNSHILIEKGDPYDQLGINLSILNLDQSKGKILTIYLPVEFKKTKHVSLGGMIEKGSRVDSSGKYQRWHYFSIPDEKQITCWLKFKGNILSTSSRELNLILWIHVDDQPEFPFRLTMTGLSLSDLNYLTPKPTFRNYYAVDYNRVLSAGVRDRVRAPVL